jgi:hypothetical protein
VPSAKTDDAFGEHRFGYHDGKDRKRIGGVSKAVVVATCDCGAGAALRASDQRSDEKAGYREMLPR